MTDTATFIGEFDAALREPAPETCDLEGDVANAVEPGSPWPALPRPHDRTACVSHELVVTRWVTMPSTHTPWMSSTSAGDGQTYALAGGGRLVLGRFQRRAEEPLECWFATGRVIGSGPRVVRYARVEIELRRHTRGLVELTIRPVARTASRWGERRRTRYFDLVHGVADLGRTSLRLA